MARPKVILDLCGGTGAWSKPYRKAGYDVLIVDPGYEGSYVLSADVRLIGLPKKRIHGVLAAPPCTHLAGSGARWWADKGEEALLEALSVVDACLRIIAMARPKWWALENPVGRLSQYLGPPHFTFDPCDFGDDYIKKTCLWGNFLLPEFAWAEPIAGQKLHRLGPSNDRAMLRSVTSRFFAQAFFEANP